MVVESLSISDFELFYGRTDGLGFTEVKTIKDTHLKLFEKCGI